MSTGEQEPKRLSAITEAARGIGEGGPNFDFLSSIISGLILGIALDWGFSTTPIFTIIGIVCGSVSGFFKLWQASASLEEQAKDRGRA